MNHHKHGNVILNISRDCAVHGSQARGSQARDNDHLRRESSSRKSSSSEYSNIEQVERWRRSSGTSSTSSSTTSSSASLNSTQHSEDIPSVSYQSTQFVSKKQSRYVCGWIINTGVCLQSQASNHHYFQTQLQKIHILQKQFEWDWWRRWDWRNYQQRWRTLGHSFLFQVSSCLHYKRVCFQILWLI